MVDIGIGFGCLVLIIFWVYMMWRTDVRTNVKIVREV